MLIHFHSSQSPLHFARIPSYSQLLQKINACASTPFQLFYSQANQSTLIENQADYMSLKYITKTSPIELNVVQEQSIIQQQVQNYLASLYDQTADEESTKYLSAITSNYLTNLYQSIQDNIANEQIEKEQIQRYMYSLKRQTIIRQEEQVMIPWNRKPKQTKLSRFSPKRIQEEKVEQIIRSSLKQMLPSVVDQITQELFKSVKFACGNCCNSSKRQYSYRSVESDNPEEYN